MKKLNLLFILLLTTSVFGQERLTILGAYNYPESYGIYKMVAIVVEGDKNMIGDPDDIQFYDAEKNKNTFRGIDDFAFLSNDEKEVWINLPKDNNSSIKAVFIVGLPLNVNRVKLCSDDQEISTSANIKGTYKKLPLIKNRKKH